MRAGFELCVTYNDAVWVSGLGFCVLILWVCGAQKFGAHRTVEG
jgi:hypothetical protein